MAFTHAKDTFVSLNASDLSAFADNVEFNPTGDSHDLTTFGQDGHVKGGGLTDGTCTVSGKYDNTASTGPQAVIVPLINTVVELIYRPEGTGSGLPERTVDVLVQSYTETSAVADYVMWSLSLEFSGSVDYTAQV